MQSVSLKVFSCLYEAITVLFNLLYDDLIRRGLCRVIFSQELLFAVRQNRQTKMRSNFLVCLKSDALCACWVVGFSFLGLVALVSDLSAFAGPQCWGTEFPSQGGGSTSGISWNQEFSWAPSCLVGVQFHSKHSLHHLNALEVLCDLMWGFL